MELIKYYTQYYIANAGCALLCLENVYKVLVQVIEKSLFFLWIYIYMQFIWLRSVFLHIKILCINMIKVVEILFCLFHVITVISKLYRSWSLRTGKLIMIFIVLSNFSTYQHLQCIRTLSQLASIMFLVLQHRPSKIQSFLLLFISLVYYLLWSKSLDLLLMGNSKF